MSKYRKLARPLARAAAGDAPEYARRGGGEVEEQSQTAKALASSPVSRALLFAPNLPQRRGGYVPAYEPGLMDGVPKRARKVQRGSS